MKKPIIAIILISLTLGIGIGRKTVVTHDKAWLWRGHVNDDKEWRVIQDGYETIRLTSKSPIEVKYAYDYDINK